MTMQKSNIVFQHTAARRRLGGFNHIGEFNNVSTHSRPKAAVQSLCRLARQLAVSTHSRPKAAADYQSENIDYVVVSTHSRPKAAEPLLKALLHQVSQP